MTTDSTPSFKLTYSTMFDPPAALHQRFEQALEGLPAPVQRYLRRNLDDGAPHLSCVRMRESGTIHALLFHERRAP